MWLDRLIVVDDKIPSSFLLDDEGNNAIIGDQHHFFVAERGFIWQHSVLNYIFCNSKESRLF
jgi:hypothetical protein